jgi:hypothetical protein
MSGIIPDGIGSLENAGEFFNTALPCGKQCAEKTHTKCFKGM